MMPFGMRVTLRDVGYGAALLFCSTQVVGSINNIGDNIGMLQVVAYLYVFTASLLLAHAISRRLLRARSEIAALSSAPLTSLVVGAGLISLVLSKCLPGQLLFIYLGGSLLGFAIGLICALWATMSWTPVLHESAYTVPAVFVTILVFYAVMILADYLSPNAGNGVRDAVAIIAIGAFLPRDENGERSPFTVLVVAAAVYAVLNGMFFSNGVIYTNPEDVRLTKIIAEAFALLAMAGFGKLLHNITRSGANRAIQKVSVCLSTALLVGIGVYIGCFVIAPDPMHAMHQTDAWVLVVAILAYDMRESSYAADGVGYGTMFEALCVGELLSLATMLTGYAVWSVALSVVFAVTYLSMVLFHFRRANDVASTMPARLSNDRDVRDVVKDAPDGVQADIPAAATDCRPSGSVLAAGLTARESEVFELLLKGHNEKLIAEELCISYHTVRCYTRHIYEKLDIHSRQDLLALTQA